MSRSFTTDDLRDLIAFPFQDPDWKNKLLVASLLILAGYLIPILPWLFVAGYVVAIMRQVLVQGQDPHLPAWDDWGQLAVDGFGFMAIGFVYLLPGIAAFVLGYVVMFASPFLSLGAVEAAAYEEAAFWSLFPLVASFGGMAFFGVGLILGWAAFLALPAAISHFVTTGEFTAAFRIREWWAAVRANLAGYGLACVIYLGFASVAGFTFQFLYMTIVCCCLIPFVSAPVLAYTWIVTSTLFAQTYKEGQWKLYPVPVEEEEPSEE